MKIKPSGKCNHYIFADVKGTALYFDRENVHYRENVVFFLFLVTEKCKQTWSLMHVLSFPYYLGWTRQKSTHWLYLQAFQRFHFSKKYQRPCMLSTHNNSNIEIDLVFALKPWLSLRKTTQEQNSHSPNWNIWNPGEVWFSVAYSFLVRKVAVL